MSERLNFQGRLVDTELAAKKLQYRIQGLRTSLRELLDPFEAVKELKAELIAEEALQLAARYGEYRAALEEIAAIEKALGR